MHRVESGGQREGGFFVGGKGDWTNTSNISDNRMQDTSSQNQLTELREKIDEVNEGLIKLLKYRFEITTKVAEYKKQKGLPIFDAEREEQVYTKLYQLASEYQLNRDFVLTFFRMIIEEASKQQEKIISNN